MIEMLIAQKNRKQTNCGREMPSAGETCGVRQRREKDAEDFEDGVAADPRLDAEPAARHQRAQQGRDVRADACRTPRGSRRGRGCRTACPRGR